MIRKLKRKLFEGRSTEAKVVSANEQAQTAAPASKNARNPDQTGTQREHRDPVFSIHFSSVTLTELKDEQ